MATANLESPHSLPADVAAFCEKTDLGPYLSLSLRLARESFEPVRYLRAELEADPDTDEERIIVEVGVEMAVDEVLERTASYTSQWVARAPLEVRQMIRLLYNIL